MAMRLTERPKSVPNTMPLNRSRTALVRRMSVDPVMPSFIAPKMPMLPKQKAETRVMMFTMYVSLPQCLPDALGKKRFGKDELADDGTRDEGHDHDGKC